ncbi:MAG TPA: hypothetical protein VFN02_05245, partial [Ktedonobacteraceae bacterium]|nr:hypothetical protein [Ktedonobacteraceae bacterium]
MLFELPVFLFQFFDATLFGEDHQVFAGIRLACRTSNPFTYYLFQFLPPEYLYRTIGSTRVPS